MSLLEWLENVARGLPAGPPWKLQLGCGVKYLDGWINADGAAHPVVEGQVGSPDLVIDMHDLSGLPDGRFSWIYSCHTIEHLYPSKLPEVLRHLHRALVPGGRLTLATTDLMGIVEHRFLEQDNGPFYKAALFGGCDEGDHPMAAHRNVFCYEELTDLLAAAGFARVRPWEPAQYPEIAALDDYASSCRAVSVLIEGIR
jgi:predicted SAM-dependent methyltransferase